MDLTYLYHQGEPEFEEFTRGRAFSEKEVYAEIGGPKDWAHRVSPATPQSSVEVQRLRAALEANHWKRAEAARSLGVSRSTLWRRIREAGLA